MITFLVVVTLALLVGFAGGFVAGVKNAQSSKVALAKQVVDKVKR